MLKPTKEYPSNRLLIGKQKHLVSTLNRSQAETFLMRKRKKELIYFLVGLNDKSFNIFLTWTFFGVSFDLIRGQRPGKYFV